MTESLDTSPPESPASPPFKLFEINFGGLCSFVEDDAEQRVLLLAAERSSVRPRLCPHASVLLFRAADFVGIEGGPFYRSFLGPGGEVLCAWDLDGCDLKIVPKNSERAENRFGLTTIASEQSFDDLLDLRPYGALDRSWLDGELHPEGLVSARIHLSSGRLSCQHKTKKRWALTLPGRQSSDGKNLGQIVTYELHGQVQANEIELTASNFRLGGRQILRLKPGAEIEVSSLCAFTGAQVFEERDVLAYYDLCREPPPVAERLRPVLIPDEVLPGQSACPPVRQSVTDQ